ncbi:MAG: DUF2703 domain-containing protein [Acidobacterium ailaaui]|nr:DUF2703 domain-containing protein [Pseudacidobacterium ailaaui]
MKIDVLYVEGCPNHLPAVQRIQQVLQDEDCQAVITEVLVPDAETAQQLRFPGSPTVRINGLDVEPDVQNAHAFGFMCRRYADGAPSYDQIRAAVRAALKHGGK